MNTLLDLALHKPNLIVTGVAHSGTSVLAKMLIELGWDRLEADDEQHTESEKVYYANQAIIKDGEPDWDGIEEMLRGKSPWMIKDPHFAFTLSSWVPVLAAMGYQPSLLVITRDHDAVVGSWTRRGEGNTDAEPHVAYAEEQLRRQILEWPWSKVVIDYERLCSAVNMFCGRG